MAGFWVDPGDVGEAELVLRQGEAHHLARSRRLGVGDQVEVLDGIGGFYRAQVEQIGKDEVVCQITARLPEWGESRVRLTLASALIKGQRFDFVVEKATEVGIARLQPLFCQRGVVRSGSATKMARWQRLALAAAKQCGRSRLPDLDAPGDLTPILAQLAATNDRILVASTGADQAPLRTCLDGPPVERVALLVGPEGGWSPTEEGQIRAAGGRAFCWGARTLRADTAGVVLAALALHEAERLLEEAHGG